MLTGRFSNIPNRLSGHRKIKIKTVGEPLTREPSTREPSTREPSTREPSTLNICSTIQMLPLIHLLPEYEYYDTIYGKPIEDTYNSTIIQEMKNILQSDEKNIKEIICEKYPIDIYKSR